MSAGLALPTLAGHRARAKRLREEIAQLLQEADRGADLVANANLLKVAAMNLVLVEDEIAEVLEREP